MTDKEKTIVTDTQREMAIAQLCSAPKCDPKSKYDLLKRINIKLDKIIEILEGNDTKEEI